MRCPSCKKETKHAYRPFCSKRCADLDLGSWFSGDYFVPDDGPEAIEKAQEEIESRVRKPH